MNCTRLLHQLWNEDTDVCFEILEIVRTHLVKGGQDRMTYTLPTFAFIALKLERYVRYGMNMGQDVAKCARLEVQASDHSFCHNIWLSTAGVFDEGIETTSQRFQ